MPFESSRRNFESFKMKFNFLSYQPHTEGFKFLELFEIEIDMNCVLINLILNRKFWI